MNIIRAIKHEELLGPYFGNSLESWKPWLTLLRVIYGLSITSSYSRELIRRCTGRNPRKLSRNGYAQVLILSGRRSGKSRIAAAIAGYSASLAGLEANLDPGEDGVVAVVAPTKSQGGVVSRYIRGVFNAPGFEGMVHRNRDAANFRLTNGVTIDVFASHLKTVRGPTLLTCIVDEVCFVQISESSRVGTDTELIRSLEPGLATVEGGKLIAISSPYYPRGYGYETFSKHYGNNRSKDVLVWKAPSRVMNPTLKQSVVDKALREDYQSARSEYLAEFRDEVGLFVDRDAVMNCVVRGRHDNLRDFKSKYHAFVDMSNGRGDASVLMIGHRDEAHRIILDAELGYPAPHNPFEVIARFADELRQWGVTSVVGDGYPLVAEAFQAKGITYTRSVKDKSQLYRELLPLLNDQRVVLLDSPTLVKELTALERHTVPGGNDAIDHKNGPKYHDDYANALAGLCSVQKKRMLIGAAGF